MSQIFTLLVVPIFKLLPIKQEVGHSPEREDRHVQMRELVLQQAHSGVKGGAKTSNTYISVQVLEDKVEGHVYGVIHRPAESVGKLQLL